MAWPSVARAASSLAQESQRWLDVCPTLPHLPHITIDSCTTPDVSPAPHEPQVLFNCSLTCELPFVTSGGSGWLACSTPENGPARWDVPPRYTAPLLCSLPPDWTIALVAAVWFITLVCVAVVVGQEVKATEIERDKRRKRWTFQANGWTKPAKAKVRLRSRVFRASWKLAHFLLNLGLTFLSFNSARVKEAQFGAVLAAFPHSWIGGIVRSVADVPAAAVIVSALFVALLLALNIVLPVILRFTYNLYSGAQSSKKHPAGAVSTSTGSIVNPCSTTGASGAFRSTASSVGTVSSTTPSPLPEQRASPVARVLSTAVYLFVSKGVPLLVSRYSVTLVLACLAPVIVMDFSSLSLTEVILSLILSSYSFLLVCVLFTGAWGWNQRDAFFMYCVVLKGFVLDPVAGFNARLHAASGARPSCLTVLWRYILLLAVSLVFVIPLLWVPVVCGLLHFMVCLLGIVTKDPQDEVNWQPSPGGPTCNLFNPRGIGRCCSCIGRDGFLAGTHKSYYSHRGSYAGSFTNAIPIVGPYVYLALKVSRTMLVAIPAGIRFPDPRTARRFSAWATFSTLVVPGVLYAAVATTAIPLPAGFDWVQQMDRQLFRWVGQDFEAVGGWHVVVVLLSFCVGAAIVFACGMTSVVARFCCEDAAPRDGPRQPLLHAAGSKPNTPTDSESAAERVCRGPASRSECDPGRSSFNIELDADTEPAGSRARGVGVRTTSGRALAGVVGSDGQVYLEDWDTTPRLAV